MDQQCASGIAADRRVEDQPFAEERHRYLNHCTAHGARPAAPKVKRAELLWIARRLGSAPDRGIGMTELMTIALERQNLHGAASAARRVIDIGRPWLRFLGWWREPDAPLLCRDQLDGYVSWMRDERGFTPSTVEQWRGNRISNLRDELEEVVVAPGGFIELAAFGDFAAFLGQEVEREVAQDAQILRAVVASVSGLVLVHGHVEDPMEAIFHAPMLSCSIGEAGDAVGATVERRGDR